MKKNNRKGFTIVELVIVIAVIAILAAVLIPTFSNMVSKANDSATLQEARNKYTEYVGEYDYAEGGSPEENIVFKIDGRYVAVKGAQMDDTIYKTLSEAKTASADDALVICDKCVDGNDDGTTCDDCGKCVEHAWPANPVSGTSKCTVEGCDAIYTAPADDN